MNLSVGIVGLPNVGKSTLFNALLKKQQALAANYPFATIEPNVGIVPVPDEHLITLAEVTKTEEGLQGLPPIKPALVEFVDIAGLVRGASEGAGLGNKFLSHIRQVAIIAHVVRVFEDFDVVREGSIKPEVDYETINTELILADLQTLENSTLRLRSGQEIKGRRQALEKLEENLNKGIPARNIDFGREEREVVNQLFLLSAKPEIIVLNASEQEYVAKNIPTLIKSYSHALGLPGDKFVVTCAKIESELAELSAEEQKQYLEGLGLENSGLERLIQRAYEALGLISFLTAGAKEVRAWTIKKGINAQNAAGEIHTDFIKNFIKSEVVSYDEFISLGGWKNAREKGRSRMEGRDYIMKDGDVVEFKIGR